MKEELSPDARTFVERALRQEPQVSPELSRTIHRGVLACIGAAGAATTVAAPAAAAATSTGAAALPTAATVGAGAGTLGTTVAGLLGKGSVLTWLISGVAVGSVTTGVALWVAPDAPRGHSESTRSVAPGSVRSRERPAEKAVPPEALRDAHAARNLPMAGRTEWPVVHQASPPLTRPDEARSQSLSAAPSKTESPSLATELAVLEKAQTELRAGRGQSALALLDRPQETPGVLTDERLLIEVLAACQTQDHERARRAADLLVLRSPQSPLALRARHSCAFAAGGPQGEP